MKKLTFYFMFLLVIPTCLMAQYAGSNGRGEISVTKNSSFLNGSVALGVGSYQNEKSIINCNPNPFKDNVAVNFISTSEEKVTVEVINIKGEKVYSKPVTVIRGKNIVMLDSSGLENGTYFVYLSNYPNQSQKVIKQ